MPGRVNEAFYRLLCKPWLEIYAQLDRDESGVDDSNQVQGLSATARIAGVLLRWASLSARQRNCALWASAEYIAAVRTHTAWLDRGYADVDVRSGNINLRHRHSEHRGDSSQVVSRRRVSTQRLPGIKSRREGVRAHSALGLWPTAHVQLRPLLSATGSVASSLRPVPRLL